MTTEKHFPTILGLIFLIICIAVGIYFTQSKITLNSKASGDCIPINPQVANITNSSADISFTTSAACAATASVNDQIFNDVKSASTTKIHYFQIKNLKKTTNYNYSIISGGQTFNGNSFNFKTGSVPTSILPTSNLAWGRVLNPDLKTAASAIVYLNIPGAAPLSSFVTTDGNWSISLASSFNDSKSDWFSPPQTAVDEDIVVISEDALTTQVTNNTALNNPVPDIIIGQNSLSSPVVTTTLAGKIGDTTPIPAKNNLDILNPQDNETLNTVRPDFFGTAPINSKVVIEIHSSDITNGESQADPTGSWHWSPPSDLAPGEHTITVKVQDSNTGLWQTITRTFTVLASSDNTLAYEASGSAVNPTSTPILTPTKTLTSSLTPTKTLIPTLTIKPSPTTKISTISGVPVTGTVLPTYLLIFSAFSIFLIAGIFL
jgi:hypothetical protein